MRLIGLIVTLLILSPTVGHSDIPWAAFTHRKPRNCNPNFEGKPVLKAFVEYLEKAEAEHDPESAKPPHSLEFVDGQGVLNVGYLQGQDKSFMKYVLLLIRDGTITKINAGAVVGPKVFISLARLATWTKENGRSLEIFGKTDIGEIMKIKAKDIDENEDDPTLSDDKDDDDDSDAQKRNYAYWSDSEKEDFRLAIKSLRVKKACEEVFGTRKLKKCGQLEFDMSIDPNQQAPQITWTGQGEEVTLPFKAPSKK